MKAGRTLAVAVLAALLVAFGVCLERFVLASPPEPPPTYLEQLDAELSLTDAQVSAIAAILADEDRDIEALRQARIEELRGPVAARRSLTESLLLDELTDEQRRRYREL